MKLQRAATGEIMDKLERVKKATVNVGNRGKGVLVPGGSVLTAAHCIGRNIALAKAKRGSQPRYTINEFVIVDGTSCVLTACCWRSIPKTTSRMLVRESFRLCRNTAITKQRRTTAVVAVPASCSPNIASPRDHH